jgi:para-nitrobenzyl esterase
MWENNMSFTGSKFLPAAMVSALLCCAAMAAPAAPATPVVRTDTGRIAGVVREDVKTFLGIPYAVPPVGDLRWRAPQPAKPWQGVRPAVAYSPVCRQNVDWIKEPQSEDCLYLNVWAPAKAGKKPLPVMVWIHGGGFHGGSGSQALYEGAALTHRGVIVVTINYRLGVFGFFAHPELSAEAPDHASGNQGIRDQIAALGWVKRNIAAFGGDPKRITIFGESAGSDAVVLLTTSPPAKGLFQRAIGESGGPGTMPDLKSAETLGVAFAAAQNAAHIADLRALPADALVKLPWSAQPNIDGAALPDNPDAIFTAHRQNDVPVLAGWNSEEGVDLAPDMFGTKEFTAANHAALLKRVIGTDPPSWLLQFYPGATDVEARDSIIRFSTDIMGWQMWQWAKMTKNGKIKPAYLYHYIHWPAEPATPCGYGCKAGHGAEVRFVFDHLGQDARAWTAADRAMADRIVRYWTNFAKTGDPNGEGLPEWAAFDGTPKSAMQLGGEDEIKARGAFPDFDLFKR